MGLIPYLLEKFISKNLAEIFELDQDSFDHQVKISSTIIELCLVTNGNERYA